MIHSTCKNTKHQENYASCLHKNVHQKNRKYRLDFFNINNNRKYNPTTLQKTKLIKP